MKNDGHKRSSQKDVELLIVEAFQCARQTLEAFERLTMAARSLSSERNEAHSSVEAARPAPESDERDGILLCTIKEACKRTGLGRSRIYQAIGSGELRARKSGARTLIEINEIRRWIASLPTIASG
jgi:excisionase family DNA binding protein